MNVNKFWTVHACHADKIVLVTNLCIKLSSSSKFECKLQGGRTVFIRQQSIILAFILYDCLLLLLSRLSAFSKLNCWYESKILFFIIVYLLHLYLLHSNYGKFFSQSINWIPIKINQYLQAWNVFDVCSSEFPCEDLQLWSKCLINEESWQYLISILLVQFLIVHIN